MDKFKLNKNSILLKSKCGESLRKLINVYVTIQNKPLCDYHYIIKTTKISQTTTYRILPELIKLGYITSKKIAVKNNKKLDMEISCFSVTKKKIIL